MLRRGLAVVVLVYSTRYFLLQAALLLLVLFCAVVLEDYARPYAHSLVELLEFLQLIAV